MIVADELLEALREAVGEQFGLKLAAAALPLNRGWMNRKWHITTNQGEYVLKQYHRDRYTDERQAALRFALGQQQRLHHSGLSCPRLLEREGEVLHHTRSGERYSVMVFCAGDIPNSARMSALQLEHMGRVTGELHQLLNDGSLSVKPAPSSGLPNLTERLAHFDKVEYALRGAGEQGEAWLPMLELHRETAAHLELSDLAASPSGWAHRDLWTDNWLVHAGGIAALLDFDRLDYDYPEHDVARALISSCYEAGKFYDEMADCWLKGYRSVRPFTAEQVERAIKLLYWLESEWWLRPGMMNELTGPPVRFREELNWLAKRFGGRRS